ncbi:hypothetical protein OGM63_02530 [Plectonema radiosum NIES-515]|uniref:Calx-beta domain-containing protein n=1 Tax=Plectonema radiosum NIES-515 TaxID=2986073 RepID=A0ABT3ATH1_9CYAN|nr:Calx-beta domain-containing protein [Plectonema radiosum]MCV3212416.1 hypothetical protein [Plectonema radiosum NIES-515]
MNDCQFKSTTKYTKLLLGSEQDSFDVNEAVAVTLPIIRELAPSLMTTIRANCPKLQLAIALSLKGMMASNLSALLSPQGKAINSAVSVNYTTANGTAIAGDDYTATNGKLTFAARETSKTVTVQVKGDRIEETDENFFLNLANATNAAIAPNAAIARAAIRFPDMRLEPDAIVPEIPHHGLRAPVTLPVLLK